MTSAAEEVFDKLEEMGASYARIHYYGSHDESYEEGAELYDHAPEAGEWFDPDTDAIKVLPTEESYYRPQTATTEEKLLGAAMYQILIDEIGTSWGDSVDGVDGTLDFYVEDRRIVLHDSYLDWVEETREVS